LRRLFACLASQRPRPAGDGAVGAAFGDARLAAKSRMRTSGSWAMRGGARARLARKVQFAAIKHVTEF
jgi:hypothetical protein